MGDPIQSIEFAETGRGESILSWPSLGQRGSWENGGSKGLPVIIIGYNWIPGRSGGYSGIQWEMAGFYTACLIKAPLQLRADCATTSTQLQVLPDLLS